MTSRGIRFETRSRARDELRRAMTAIDKVKKWEKKWVQAGGPTCKLSVFKWVPRELTQEEKEIESKENKEPKEVKPEESLKAKPFVPSDTNEDSRDSIGKLEFMKYCQDPDSQDSMHSITESEKTAFSEDQDTKQSSNSLPATSGTAEATVTVADAFNKSDTPKLSSVPVETGDGPPTKKVKVDEDTNDSVTTTDSVNTETNDSVES